MDVLAYLVCVQYWYRHVRSIIMLTEPLAQLRTSISHISIKMKIYKQCKADVHQLTGTEKHKIVRYLLYYPPR